MSAPWKLDANNPSIAVVQITSGPGKSASLKLSRPLHKTSHCVTLSQYLIFPATYLRTTTAHISYLDHGPATNGFGPTRMNVSEEDLLQAMEDIRPEKE
jgi:hypothetical protein